MPAVYQGTAEASVQAWYDRKRFAIQRKLASRREKVRANSNTLPGSRQGGRGAKLRVAWKEGQTRQGSAGAPPQRAPKRK